MAEIDYRQELEDLATNLNNWAEKIFEQCNELLMEAKNALKPNNELLVEANKVLKLNKKLLSLIENIFLLDYLSSKLDQADPHDGLSEYVRLRALCSAVTIVMYLPKLNLNRTNEPENMLNMFILGHAKGLSDSYDANKVPQDLFIDGFASMSGTLTRRKKWDQVRKELDEALKEPLKLADTMWETGDKRLHHKMARYLNVIH